MQKKIRILAFSITLLLLFSCSNKEQIITEKEKNTHKSAVDVQLWINSIFAQKADVLNSFIKEMPLEEKIGQLFIENLEGNKNFRPVEKINEINTKKTDDDTFIIPGGYLFFSFNIADKAEDIISFTDSIKKYCYENNRIPPFLAVDQEGGYVNRLKKINGPLPSAENVAAKFSLSDTYDLYSLQAKQMKILGFNMNLAPVCEVCTEDNEKFLTERSFGDSNKVIDFGKICINAYEDNQIAAVLKHFPGNTNTDPHTGLPEITLSYKNLFDSLEPFKQLLQEKPAGILMSHARTTEIDSEVPACLSNIWVTEILRNQFNYEGIIFSDDIFMAALSSNGFKPEKAVIMAIEAGIDCIMISEKRIAKPAKVLYEKAINDEIFAQKIDSALKRIILFKLNNGILKYTEDGKGGYKIVINQQKNNIVSESNITQSTFAISISDKKLSTMEEKLTEFDKLKQQNTTLYNKYF